MSVEFQTTLIAAVASVIVSLITGYVATRASKRNQDQVKENSSFTQAMEMLNEAQDDRRELRDLVSSLKKELDDTRVEYRRRLAEQDKLISTLQETSQLQNEEIKNLRGLVSSLKSQNTRLKNRLERYKKEYDNGK